ncbi:DUF2399 domain-containing protein, partial [Actinomadura adrarensis]
DLLAAGGAEFAYHGDFDWGGVAIASAVRERVGCAGWRPWRYDADAYLNAVKTGAPLTGSPVPTPWDPSLGTAMTERGVRAEEELVLNELLDDLAL